MASRRWRSRIAAVAGAAAVLVAGCAASSSDPEEPDGFPAGLPITRVSVNSGGVGGDGDSLASSVSGDGRYVAFTSEAGNLVAGDTNLLFDIFVRDRQSGTIERVSVGSGGTQGNGDSIYSSISADGRYVAFDSRATNLVPGDTNGCSDIFVYDRRTGSIERVSVGSGGTQGDGESILPSISGDGRYVAFESTAANLVANDTNGCRDIFVYDRQTGTIERVSVDSSGAQADDISDEAAISADGRFVAFRSMGSNLVSGDSGGFTDIFVHDRQSGVTERVSVDASGTEASGHSYTPAISTDGRFVAFASAAANLVSGDNNGYEDIFVYDRQTGAIERVSLGPGGAEPDAASYAPAISADGRYAAFASPATNLAAGDTNGKYDIFVRDRQTGVTRRVSVSAAGIEGDGDSYGPRISADGRYVSFESGASNLIPGDTNGRWDVFAAANP